MIDPTSENLVFVRFKHRAVIELAVCKALGAWSWYDVMFCRRDQKIYLTLTAIGQPSSIPVYCDDDELVACFWADPVLVPQAIVKVLPGGPCARLSALPLFLQGEQFVAWCKSLGYANEMIPCVYCQDFLPVPEEIDQRPCEHIRWCIPCQMWSSPNYPGKELEMVQCPHRTQDDLSLQVATEPGGEQHGST